MVKYAGNVQRVHALVAGPATAAATDVDKLYIFPLAVSSAIRKTILVFRQLDYIIPNWTGDSFPNVIYLTVVGLKGYVGVNTDGTISTSTKAAAL